MAERWRVKPKGFPTIKKGGWWVRPQARQPAPRAGAPTGGTPANSTRTAAINRLQPRQWTGSEGLIGPWKNEPRLNPDQYEWTLNPENNRWFARPRTETTGLDHQQRADLAAFDRQTGAQQQRIGEVYDAYATQAGQDRDAAAQAFGTLAKLSSAGFSDAISGPAPGPFGPVAPVGLSQAERALPGVLAQGAREGAAASSGQSLFGLSQLPTLARDAKVTGLERYGAERQGQRSEFLSSARQVAAEREAAAAEAAFRDKELAATLRGQNLDHLGRVISGETQVQTATIRADTATQDRLARLQSDAAKLQNQLQIARERNMTSRANTLANNLAKKQAAIKKEKAKRASGTDQRAWAKRAREMWEGIPRRVTGDDGKTTTEYLQYDTGEIIRELMAMGAPRGQAVRIARQISGREWAGSAAPSGLPGLVGGGF